MGFVNINKAWGEGKNAKLQFMSTNYESGLLHEFSLITRAALQGRDVVDRAPEAWEESVLMSHSPARKSASRISTQIQRPMLHKASADYSSAIL